MRNSIILAGIVGLLAVAPATGQELPVFKKPPIAGPVSASRSCVRPNPIVQQGGIMRQADRGGLGPRPVPASQQVRANATKTVTRPVLRTFLQLRLGVDGATVADVANSLRAARDRLAQSLGGAGYRVLSTETLTAKIEAALPGRRPASGSARVVLLVEGEAPETEMRALIDAAGGGRIERLVFDFANSDAVAEDLRTELERRVQANAAARAAEQEAELVELLSSRLTSRGRRRSGTTREAGVLTITAAATFRMTPALAVGGN